MKREDIAYYYQPIVSAVTGKIRALEALMHVEMSMLKSPEDVLRLAKEKNAFMIWKESLFLRGRRILQTSGKWKSKR